MDTRTASVGAGTAVLILLSTLACASKVTPAPARFDGEEAATSAVCASAKRCGQLAADAPCDGTAGSGGSTFDTPAALFASVRAGAVTVDAVKAPACFEAIRNRSCDTAADDVFASGACAQAFRGTLGADQACIANGACVAGTACLPTASSADDACRASCVPLASGACRRDLDCGDGRLCENDRCVEFRGPGARDSACGTGGTCEDGLSCRYAPDADGDSAQGRCVAPPRAGEPCSVGDRLACADASLACVPTADFRGATCRRVVALGAACELPFDCGGVASGLFCRTDAAGGYTAGRGQCAALPTSGPCIAVGPLHLCDPRASFCDESATTPACRPFRDEGALCSTRGDCGPRGSGVDCVGDGPSARRCTPLGPTVVCRL